jgi:hypothetical protein
MNPNQCRKIQERKSEKISGFLTMIQGTFNTTPDRVVYSTEKDSAVSVLRMSIYSCDGRLLAASQVNYTSKISMNTAFLHKGIYFVKISLENISVFSRLMVA